MLDQTFTIETKAGAVILTPTEARHIYAEADPYTVNRVPYRVNAHFDTDDAGEWRHQRNEATRAPYLYMSRRDKYAPDSSTPTVARRKAEAELLALVQIWAKEHARELAAAEVTHRENKLARAEAEREEAAAKLGEAGAALEAAAREMEQAQAALDALEEQTA